MAERTNGQPVNHLSSFKDAIDNPQPTTATRYSISAKVKCLTLLSLQFHPEVVRQLSGVPRRTQINVNKTALERGWNGTIEGLEDQHVKTGKATGRPRKNGDLEIQAPEPTSEDRTDIEERSTS